MKLKVNPGFILVILFCHAIDSLKNFILFFLMICVHDIAHYLLAHYYGVSVESIELMPFGCEMKLDDSFIDNGQKAFIYLVGPLTNIIISIVLYLLKMYDVYMFALYDEILFANLILGVLNLLPLHPLDGSVVAKIMLSKVLGNIKATKVILILTQIVAYFLISITVYCLMNQIYNISFGLVGIFLLFQTFRGKDDLLIDAMQGEINKRKHINASGKLMKSDRICVSSNISLKKLINYFSGNRYYIIEVVDSRNRYVGTITEEDVIDGIIKYGYNCTVRDILR